MPLAPHWHIPPPCPSPLPVRRQPRPAGTISIHRLFTSAYPTARRNTDAFASRATPPEVRRTWLALPVLVLPATAMPRSSPARTPTTAATRPPSAPPPPP